MWGGGLTEVGGGASYGVPLANLAFNEFVMDGWVRL